MTRPNDWTDALTLTKSAVFDVAEDLLASLVTRMSAVAPGPALMLPARQYVHQGEIALDCELLAVSLMGLEHAMPDQAPQPAICAPPRSVQFDVWLIRCVPVQTDDGTPPSEADLTDSAETLMTDLWSLSYVLWNYRNDWAPTCMSKLFGPVTPYGPQGAFGGSHASVFLQLL